MIKTDYKTHKSKKPIFSPKKNTARAPILLITAALVFISWGLGSIILDDTDSEQAVATSENGTISTPLSTNNEQSDKSEQPKVFEIALDLETPDAANNRVVKSDITAKPSSTISPQPEAARPWQTTKIRRGDSTSTVFKRHKLNATDLYNIMQLGKPTAILKRVQAGHQFDYQLDKQGTLMGIRYHIDKLNTLEVIRHKSGWQANKHTKPVEIRQASASGKIESSLFLAGKKAGMSDALVMELAGIFGWDIDFILDIRQGDRFTLIYEEKYVEGDKFGNGNILAAEFVNQGKSFKAIRYTDSKGDSEYYNPEGLSMRKAFLRAPLDFSYVSSNFNPKRFHPVLKRVKAHRGIDYKAPRGTPIKAAGDGKVIRSAYDKYNGHHVFIQHGQKYTTKYLHFTKRKVKTGQRVKQGQVIGTLGSTGMVTGAHLHYEFLVNGVHRNPKTVKLPDAEPIPKREKDRFLNQSASLLAQLNKRVSLQQVQLANAD